MKITGTIGAPLAGVLLCACLGAAQAAGMQVSSASFADGASIPVLHGNDASDCGGKGVSPQVSWTNLPAGTRSVAVLLSDPDGAMGLGVSHWVAYNIAAERGQLRQGEGQTDGHGVTLGKNVRGGMAYHGPCPPVGDVPHHYTLTVVATDIAPSALPPGLTREALMAALKGHALGAQSVIGRYGR
ncbi:YbhB/YbcL family Raf kinase inhibitor-like protein [Cupriavidus basilensis]|uniref:YbhB/YbcL family Raf kinase inhibitor-like protein n=1 Tax=Cupriavidus basilensis TaxID=68895 RepID=A0ABT6AI71_9BURK|nr:YbhB/YbcL family Raf kinase inhibitor-like protein [Cupriavidus basilensis]MDF3832300.1 YbhB/YbcL family Raf kinase inhibitor-like protein [Cupriavidus basilensis]